MRKINRMKSGLLIFSIFLVACNPLLGSFKDKGTQLVSGEHAPNNHWAGQWRIINIWAEWCKPCWQEIPELNHFFALQSDKDIKLLGFNFDELELDELRILKEKMSIQFPVLTRWPENWAKPEVKGLPATIILSPDDKVMSILWGPQNLASLHQGVEDAKRKVVSLKVE